MVTSRGSRFDMRFNPVYQVDWQHEASGKKIAATKRRVRFRFGFSNAEAIAQGHKGPDCRGEEHEVVLVWSLTSGKRLVLADGEEVHFSTGKMTDAKFEASWTISGGHMIKIIAHAAPPLFNTPGFRQFDLQLDGCSFFDMPRIYELGHNSVASRDMVLVETPVKAYQNYQVPRTPARENRTSVQQQPGYEFSTPKSPQRTSPETYPEPRTSVATPYPSKNAAQITPRRIDSSPVDVFSAPVPVRDHFEVQQVPARDEFTPMAPPPPSYSAVSQQILSAYGPPPPTPGMLALPYESHTHYTTPTHHHRVAATGASPYYYQGTLAQNAAPFYTASALTTTPARVQPEGENRPVTVLTPTMEPLSLEEMEAREQPTLSEMERALKTLVNLEDIHQTTVTPEQIKTRVSKKNKEPLKSKPLPPVTPEWHLGSKASLGDIKENAKPKAAPAKEIMRTHVFDPAAAQAGMMVVYGSTPSNMPQHMGFGAGVHHSHYAGHARQQMYAAY